MKEKRISEVQASVLKSWLHDGEEIALLDVREAGQFGESHLFLAIPLPYSRLEIDVRRLVPRLTTRIVLIDETGRDVALLAAQRLGAMGYTQVQILQAGIQGWADAGYEVFAGVNVPSKAFGELAEMHFGTPHISAKELSDKLARGEDVIVLDGRPMAEFHKMSIPGATCCPNGELALRIDDLVPSAKTQIVVNCAGRTRSIVGAQTLINLGIPNPVRALENGTQGWYLNDLMLEHGANRGVPALDASADLRDRVERAQRLADRFDIERIDLETLSRWQAESERTTYVCDVRTPEEMKARPITGANPAPGGQLIQATDQYIATRGARVVLVDDDDVRAPVVASWLYMLGWDVAVLPSKYVPSLTQGSSASPHTQVHDDDCVLISAVQARELHDQNMLFLDARSSMQYRQSHIVGSNWVVRPKLGAFLHRLAALPESAVLIANEYESARLLRKDLMEAGVKHVHCCIEEPAMWSSAGLPVESTPDDPTNSECIDYLFFVHDRHDGNKQAARQYLAWETNLISQLDDQEKNIFRFTSK